MEIEHWWNSVFFDDQMFHLHEFPGFNFSSGKFSEAGCDAVDDLVLTHDVLHHLPGLQHLYRRLFSQLTKKKHIEYIRQLVKQEKAWYVLIA